MRLYAVGMFFLIGVAVTVGGAYGPEWLRQVCVGGFVVCLVGLLVRILIEGE